MTCSQSTVHVEVRGLLREPKRVSLNVFLWHHAKLLWHESNWTIWPDFLTMLLPLTSWKVWNKAGQAVKGKNTSYINLNLRSPRYNVFLTDLGPRRSQGPCRSQDDLNNSTAHRLTITIRRTSCMSKCSQVSLPLDQAHVQACVRVREAVSTPRRPDRNWECLRKKVFKKPTKKKSWEMKKVSRQKREKRRLLFPSMTKCGFSILVVDWNTMARKSLLSIAVFWDNEVLFASLTGPSISWKDYVFIRVHMLKADGCHPHITFIVQSCTLL